MFQRLSNWLRRFVDRLKHSGQSVQYELQRMTHKGGWKNFYVNPNYDSADAFPIPPPKPFLALTRGTRWGSTAVPSVSTDELRRL